MSDERKALYEAQDGRCALTAIPMSLGPVGALEAVLDGKHLICKFVAAAKGEMSFATFKSVVLDAIDSHRSSRLRSKIGFTVKSDAEQSPVYAFLWNIYDWVRTNYWLASMEIELLEDQLTFEIPKKWQGQFGIDIGDEKNKQITVMTSWSSNEERSVLLVNDGLIEFMVPKVPEPKIQTTKPGGTVSVYNRKVKIGKDGKKGNVIFQEPLAEPGSIEKTIIFLKDYLEERLITEQMSI